MKIKFKNSFKIEHFRFISTAGCLFLHLDYEWNVMVSIVVKLELTTIYICFKTIFFEDFGKLVLKRFFRPTSKHKITFKFKNGSFTSSNSNQAGFGLNKFFVIVISILWSSLLSISLMGPSKRPNSFSKPTVAFVFEIISQKFLFILFFLVGKEVMVPKWIGKWKVGTKCYLSIIDLIKSSKSGEKGWNVEVLDFGFEETSQDHSLDVILY